MGDETDDQKLRRRVAWLNSTGGFTNQIIFSKVAEAAQGLDEAKVMQTLKYVEDNWEKVWDPTAWICSSLEKAKEASDGLDPAFDQQLRKQIRWLNTGGGWDNTIMYAKVAEAACWVEPGRVMEVLRYLEEGCDKIEDPTAWVCTGLRKAAAAAAAGGGQRTGGGGNGGKANQAWDRWDPEWDSQRPAQQRQPQWTWDADGADEDAVWRRIRWLNTKGGFQDAVSYDAVAEVVANVRTSRVMEVLKQLEDSWQSIGDPTSWVCATLRRDANRQGLDPQLDRQLRRHVRWLNEEGGFENAISYSKIAEAAEGVEGKKVFELLDHLEGNWGRISAPTEWVCTSLRKAAKGGGGGGGWQPGGTSQSADAELPARLRKRIGWLNTEGGFENTITYRKVAEACEGMDGDKVMSVLKSLEERGYEAKDPTAWVCAALSRARRGGASSSGLKTAAGNSGRPPLRSKEGGEWAAGHRKGGR